MRPRLQHRPVVSEIQSSPLRPTDQLDDDYIEHVLRHAFAPHRCVVEFQEHRTKIALRVYGLDRREFLVEGKRIDLLRYDDTLAEYVADVRFHLRQRKLIFNSPLVRVDHRKRPVCREAMESPSSHDRAGALPD
jgi:hypothetical protein